MSESEKTSSKTNSRPGYTYAATFGQQGASDQFVRVKLEINGQVQIVPVCLLCHKAFRLCSLDPNVTEEMIANCKYLGLADAVGQDSSDQNHSTDSKDTKDAKDTTDSKDSKDSKDANGKKDLSSTGSTTGKEHDKDKESGKGSEEEKKKKKKWGDSDQQRREMPKTEWTTNKPSHEDWEKKKKKDY